MKKHFHGLNWDFIGFSASTLCAIHCLALPFVMTLSAMSGFQFLESPILEYSMLVIAITIAIRSLIPSYQRHKRPQALGVFLLSLVLIIISRFFPEESAQELVFTVSGGFGFALAHVINWRALSYRRNASRQKMKSPTKSKKAMSSLPLYAGKAE